jgi:hypothetical protein
MKSGALGKSLVRADGHRLLLRAGDRLHMNVGYSLWRDLIGIHLPQHHQPR